MKPINLKNQPDFKKINITTDNPREYTWQERRAEIYQLIQEKGYPDFNLTKLGKKYGVSTPQISYDLSVLRKYIAQDNDEDLFLSTGKLIWKKGIKKYEKTGKYIKANTLWKTWKDFLYEDGIRTKEPSRVEINHLENVFERTDEYLQQNADLKNKEGGDVENKK